MSILEDSARRQLRIECSEIRLTKGGPVPLAFNGPGTIWIDKDGQINFEFSLSVEENRAYDEAAIRQAHQTFDQPKEEDYFELSALSGSGEVFEGKLLYPEWADTPGIAKGKLIQLQSTRQVTGQTQSIARMLLPRKLDFPQIEGRDGRRSSQSDCRFELANDEKLEIFDKVVYTEIVCSVQPRGIAQNRYWRMVEAVEFAFGQSIYPCAIEVQEDGTSTIALNSANAGLENEGKLESPIHLGRRVHHFPITELISRFYNYVLPYTKEFPPLIVQGLWGMRQAADAQPDVKGLVFAAAAETLIRACFPNIKPISSDFRSKVRALQKQIEIDTQIDSTLKKRATGALNGLLSSQNSERIREFLRWHVRDEKLQDSLFDDWKELRDGSAHGGKIRSETDYVTQQRINSTHDLCYAIVLSRISYYHQTWWNTKARRYVNSWSLVSLNQSLPTKPPAGSLIIPSRFPWRGHKRGVRKEVIVGKEAKQAITLFARPAKDGKPPFRIEVCPKAILPDDLAPFQIKTEYATLKEAMEACDNIASRALVHITIDHFHAQKNS
jgi:hypothetical protein